MNRRKFMKVTATTVVAATTTSLPKTASAASADETYESKRRKLIAEISKEVPEGFMDTTRTFEEFCDAPQDDRIFYALTGSKIVPERLNSRHWRPTGWGNPPVLPIPGGSHDGVPMVSPFPNLYGDGPFEPTWESFQNYECPEWYRDAKFGIWNHWSPQCVPEDGDWYARNMYIENSGQYDFELAHYGPQCRFGYKDLCAQWTLLNWEPEHRMAEYKAAGAKYFLALANHHDGFDTWNSEHHQWNAHNIGPHRDVIGTWAQQARNMGLKFGVTIHQARNWWWFQTSHNADKLGPYVGRPYDGCLTEADGRHAWWSGYNPQQLYNAKHPHNALPDVSYAKNFYDRTRNLIDLHNPDILYFDNPLFPLGWAGMNIGAYFYNNSMKLNGGKVEGVVNIKIVPPNLAKTVVADIERGLAGQILPYPWQSETCIGDWHYLRALFDQPGKYGGYLHPREVIHWMIDAVSKNGNFVLNIPGKPDGTIDRKEKLILSELAQWFKLNGDAIYATRPWVVYGEGPTVVKAGSFAGASVSDLGVKDIRFTRNKANTVVNALLLGVPTQPILIKSLGLAPGVHATKRALKVTHVRLYGYDKPIKWKQSATGLQILPPRDIPHHHFAVAFAISVS
ncbi:MAG: alpha-L-fucosidase [Phycisphaerae bacterium]